MPEILPRRARIVGALKMQNAPSLQLHRPDARPRARRRGSLLTRGTTLAAVRCLEAHTLTLSYLRIALVSADSKVRVRMSAADLADALSAPRGGGNRDRPTGGWRAIRPRMTLRFFVDRPQELDRPQFVARCARPGTVLWPR